jgi:hypothetical protein
MDPVIEAMAATEGMKDRAQGAVCRSHEKNPFPSGLSLSGQPKRNALNESAGRTKILDVTTFRGAPPANLEKGRRPRDIMKRTKRKGELRKVGKPLASHCEAPK